MPDSYILALDQGTTSSRAILFDKAGAIQAVAQKEFKQYYPQPGWVEHDAEEIWSSQIGVMAEVMAKLNIGSKQVAAIGITNQRETTIVWEKSTGKPIYPAIVWQDRRTASYCDQLKSQGLAKKIQEKTGLIIDAYFSATKLKWILEQVPGARQKAEDGLLAFGTVDSWLLWKLSAGAAHMTDASNASRTMLMNIHSCQWDEELLRIFQIPPAVLPTIQATSQIYASTSHQVAHAPGIPIASMVGDQQAALFGQLCTRPGMVKNTYGTGCFMLMHTGSKAVVSQANLLTTVAWKLNNQVEYALEGSIFIAGAVVQWLRDSLHLIRSAPEVEALAARVLSTDGVYLVPAFAGLGAPHWNPYARGSIFGLTRGTTDAHLARAALESIAYQTYDVLRAMQTDSGIQIRELRVDGGATANNLLMQFQSDILGVPVLRPKVYETTALGAAYFAGLAVGYWKSVHDLQEQWQEQSKFTPGLGVDEVAGLLRGWQRAVGASIAWAQEGTHRI
jgi:glycerol kinase